MHIEIDDKSGFCFGVVKAITKAEESLSSGEKVYSLGDIVRGATACIVGSRDGLTR